MVDLVTMQRVAVARGGSRAEAVRATADGRVLVAQSNQIDVLNPILTPHVVNVNPAPDALVPLPRGSIRVTSDRDMLVGGIGDGASVVAAAN